MRHGHGCHHITETNDPQMPRVSKNMDEYDVVGFTGHGDDDGKTVIIVNGWRDESQIQRAQLIVGQYTCCTESRKKETHFLTLRP